MNKKITVLLVLALPAIMAVALWGATLKFYADDPLQREPETRNASNAKAWDIDLVWDGVYHLFTRPGDPAKNVRAQNVNTIDEVPDSNWFTNRILARPVSIEEAVKGPLTDDGPPQPWTITKPKEAGAAPGFRMSDAKKGVWFVSFDGKGHPEAATGALMVANKIYWTLGYWQVEAHLISIHPEDLKIAESAKMKMADGKERPMRRGDLDDVLRRAERSADGSYRAVATKGIPGKILGGFRFEGTRPDDPNDIVPHEHRRELRALQVFGAWTNLVDMWAGNTLDSVIEDGGKNVVRHYLQDVGSTFGTGAVAPHEYSEGWEYLFEGSPLTKRLLTFGLYIRPWQTADYQELPSIGRFESKAFDPTGWKPRIPNPAFARALPDDSFWAARRVMAFTDGMIRAIVETGHFSDTAAKKLLADTLIARRDKMGKAYLSAVTPLVNFALDGSGVLTFENAAVAAGTAAAPTGGYKADWASFDNLTNQTQSLGAPTTSQAGRMQAPAGLPAREGSFVKAEVAAVGTPNQTWTVPISVYFRRDAGNWKLVGLERQAAPPPK